MDRQTDRERDRQRWRERKKEGDRKTDKYRVREIERENKIIDYLRYLFFCVLFRIT